MTPLCTWAIEETEWNEWMLVPSTDRFVADVGSRHEQDIDHASREAADPGYLEDAAVEDYAVAMANDRQIVTSLYNNTSRLYSYNYTNSTSTNCTISYGGGGSSGTWATTAYGTLTYKEPMVNQPWTLERATGEWLQTEQTMWLDAERQWRNDWLDAEARWKEGERQRQRDAAKAKAEALLFSLLPEPEVQRYRLQGYFEVIGSHGGHYQIYRGVAGNITWMHPDGKRGDSLCCHPDTFDGVGRLPAEDVMLGQLLALQTDEAEFVRTANGRKPPHLRRHSHRQTIGCR
jgi:hypothetical protein